MRHEYKYAIVALAFSGTVSVFGQATGASSLDFGNWLRAYGDNLRVYQNTPGFPNLFRFAVFAGDNLVSISYNTDPRNTDPRPDYLASIIPTPGLCGQSTSGTS